MRTDLQPSSEYAVRGVPLIVYQMGKVGSESIVKSLREFDLPFSVHHIHVLSAAKIQKTTEQLTENGIRIPIQLTHSLAVREYLDSRPDREINVITAVREPLAQLVSSFFQNMPIRQPQLIDEDGAWKSAEISSFVKTIVENYQPATEWNCNWFDHDFNPAIGVDIYQYPFDHESGFITIEKQGVRILVLRLENSGIWEQAVSDFLGLDSVIPLVRENAATTKNYHQTYRCVTENLKFSADTLNNIYSTRYCRHFYSDSMIQGFKNRWSSAEYQD